MNLSGFHQLSFNSKICLEENQSICYIFRFGIHPILSKIDRLIILLRDICALSVR